MPADPARLQQDCYEAYNIQVAGLEQRLRALNYPKVVLGVSGGLDSTHALIVAARAMDREGRPRSDILAFTLPGFATGERTKNNAIRLADALGVTFEEIDIKSTAELMLKEMDHPFARGEKVYDVTFENVQAGLRTDYLFRLANQRGGIVLGTGDLSELALGWSTYGVGDQMSHYNVNGGVPKTLIQHLIRWVISSHEFDDAVNEVLQSVLDTEITPELVPTGEDEEIQSSEAKVGPYVLQDFSLFQVLRYGFRPSKSRVPGVARVERPRARRLAGGIPGEQAAGLLAQGDSPLAAGVRAAVLLVRPVQTVGDAQRAEGVARRIAVTARRLAGAVGHVGAHLARRDRTRNSRGLGTLDASDSGNEAADAGAVVAVCVAVLGQQVRLLDGADLQLDRDDEEHEADDGHEIRCHQGDSEAEDHHRGEDRVAYPTEYAAADQRRRLARVDTDPPRVAHVELGVDRRGDADHRDRGAGGLNPRCVQDAKRRHDAEQLQDRREGRHTHRHDEPDTGRPLDRTRATGDAAKSGRSGAAPLFPTAPTESERGEHREKRERDDGHAGPSWMFMSSTDLRARR